MLDKVKFTGELTREEYHAQRDTLSRRLMVLQQWAKVAGLGTVVIFEGWHAAGKGARISDLVVNLDPRLYSVHNISDPVGYEARLPFMSRFWSRLGAHGTMTIFNRSYYSALSQSFVDDVHHAGDLSSDPKVNDVLAKRAQRHIEEHMKSAVAFERQLTADGYLIVKFFLHIPKDVQVQRTTQLILDPDSAWKVSQDDLRQIQLYEEYREVFDRWLTDKKLQGSEWNVVPSIFRRNANVQIWSTLAKKMTEALQARGFDPNQPLPSGETKPEPASLAPVVVAAAEPAEQVKAGEDEAAGQAEKAEEAKPAEQDKPKKKAGKRDIGSAKDLTSRFKLVEVPSLGDVRHDLALSEEDYHKKLDDEQDRLRDLQLILYRRRIPLVIAYEGWDAAGKGGNIKRVASSLDARNYQVHPVAAPSKEELAHPFLWRFWTNLPRTGHVAIFDRTWYGRVLVERIEGFAKPEEWRRAYDEINEFEEDLRIWGAILVKFWVDVSDEEQLRRFHDREDDPERRWKITDEDWRNRDKNGLYRTCINDMLRLTSTEYAPWTIVESDNKYYARVKALKTINDAIEKRLKRISL